MRSYVLYVSNGISNVAAISATDKVFVDKLKAWAESEGYRVEFSKDDEHGSEHQ
jgi:hypothetical protein